MILKDKQLNSFPLKFGKGKVVLLSQFLLNIMTTIGKKTKKRGIQIERRKYNPLYSQNTW
jgi:hypothetical protein